VHRTRDICIELDEGDLELLERYAREDKIPTTLLGRYMLQRGLGARRRTIGEIIHRCTASSLLAGVPQEQLEDIDVPASTKRYTGQVSQALLQRYPGVNHNVRCEDEPAQAIPPWTVLGEGGHEHIDSGDIITYQLEPIARAIFESGHWMVRKEDG
jgi:hypothetical protein